MVFFHGNFFRGLCQRFFLKRFRSIFQIFFSNFFSRILLSKFLFSEAFFFSDFFENMFFSVIFLQKGGSKKGFFAEGFYFWKKKHDYRNTSGCFFLKRKGCGWSKIYVIFSKMFCENFFHKKGFSIGTSLLFSKVFL